MTKDLNIRSVSSKYKFRRPMLAISTDSGMPLSPFSCPYTIHLSSVTVKLPFIVLVTSFLTSFAFISCCVQPCLLSLFPPLCVL